MTKEELKLKLDHLKKEVDKIWDESFSIDDNPFEAFNWYRTHPTVLEYCDVRREYKLVCDYFLRDMDNFDKECIMPINDFIKCVESGCLCDSDGSGFYATKKQVSNVAISPSDITAGKYRSDFEYVCWYNK